jgi:hypothetical protein
MKSFTYRKEMMKYKNILYCRMSITLDDLYDPLSQPLDQSDLLLNFKYPDRLLMDKKKYPYLIMLMSISIRYTSHVRYPVLDNRT